MAQDSLPWVLRNSHFLFCIPQDPKYYADRQRFTINGADGKKVVLAEDKNTLESYGVKDGCEHSPFVSFFFCFFFCILLPTITPLKTSSSRACLQGSWYCDLPFPSPSSFLLRVLTLFSPCCRPPDRLCHRLLPRVLWPHRLPLPGLLWPWVHLWPGQPSSSLLAFPLPR